MIFLVSGNCAARIKAVCFIVMTAAIAKAKFAGGGFPISLNFGIVPFMFVMSFWILFSECG